MGDEEFSRLPREGWWWDGMFWQAFGWRLHQDPREDGVGASEWLEQNVLETFRMQGNTLEDPFHVFLRLLSRTDHYVSALPFFSSMKVG